MRGPTRRAIGIGLLAKLVIAMTCGPAALPAAASDFYRGKTISIVVGTGDGGPYAIGAQMLARHWSRHIPGNPNIIVQAMPGAGGLKMASWLHTVAPKDGTVVGMPVQTVAMAQVLEPAAAKYDVGSWSWLGNMAVLRQSIVVVASSPVKSMAEARQREVVIGSTAPGGNLFIVPKLARELASANFKIILGYRGTADLDKAMEGGELQGRGGTWNDWKLHHPDWAKGDKIIPLALTGTTRDPDAPNVPLLRELVSDPIDIQVVDFFGQTDMIARPFAAVPGTPPELVAILRASFAATMKDPELIADTAKRRWPFEPTGWQEVQKAVEDTLRVSSKVVARMQEVLARK